LTLLNGEGGQLFQNLREAHTANLLVNQAEGNARVPRSIIPLVSCRTSGELGLAW
jgi:hypothetical protein